MEELIRQTHMIQPTKFLLNLDTYEQVENTRRDFAYFIVCSTDKFANPSLAIPSMRQESIAKAMRVEEPTIGVR
jgi:hypothetical protein